MERNTTRLDVIGCRFVHPTKFIRGVVFAQVYILLCLFVGWLRSGTKHTTNRRNRMYICTPVTFIRGVVFVHIYILLHLFVGWFTIKFTSYYVYSRGGLEWKKHRMSMRTSVYSWGGFRTNLHPITFIRGVVSVWKNPPHIYFHIYYILL